MKQILLAACLILTAGVYKAGAADLSVDDIESKIESVTQELVRLDVEMSRLLVRSYVDLQRLRGKNIDLAQFPGYNGRRLADTVARVGELYDAIETIRMERRQIMSRDGLYEYVEEIREKARESGDADLQKESERLQDNLFRRLRENDPEYVEVNDRYNSLRREYEYEVALYLTDYYTEMLNIPVPVNDMIQFNDRRMLESNPLYQELLQRKNILYQIRGDLITELSRFTLNLNP